MAYGSTVRLPSWGCYTLNGKNLETKWKNARHLCKKYFRRQDERPQNYKSGGNDDEGIEKKKLASLPPPNKRERKR